MTVRNVPESVNEPIQPIRTEADKGTGEGGVAPTPPAPKVLPPGARNPQDGPYEEGETMGWQQRMAVQPSAPGKSSGR